MSTLTDHVKNFASSLPQNTLLLDVGCGKKPYLSLFDPSTKYIGIDAFFSGRPDENKIADLFFDGKYIPLSSNSVDVILCTQVLEHAYDPNTLMQEIYRVMKPGRIGLITVPFIWGEHEPPFDFRRFTSFGIKKFISDHKLHAIHYEQCCTGLSAIQTILFSEVNHFKTHTRIVKSNFEKIKFNIIDKFCHKFILILFNILSKFYQLERVYLDNVIVFKKENIN